MLLYVYRLSPASTSVQMSCSVSRSDIIVKSWEFRRNHKPPCSVYIRCRGVNGYLDDHLKRIITYNLTMTIPRFARRAATIHPHQFKPDPRGEDGKYVGSKRRPRERRMSFKVRVHSSLTRRPVSSNVQKTSF